MVGLGGHIGVIVVTMTITVTKLYHPFGAAPLLGLQTVLRVPAYFFIFLHCSLGLSSASSQLTRQLQKKSPEPRFEPGPAGRGA